MNDFLRVAILGTGQVGESRSESTGTRIDPLVDALALPERERAFLLRAGALALATRASGATLRDVARPTPSGEDDLRRPSDRLASSIASVLRRPSDELTLDLLANLAAARLRLPDDVLPIALAEKRASVRARIRPVLGARGLWLAAVRPEWGWALGQDPEASLSPEELGARWDDASAADRLVLLRRARAIDPDLARRLVASSWKQEKAEQRLAWLDAITATLVRDDAPFLVEALGDRSAQVRVAAARMLWQFADSEAASRVRALAESSFARSGAGGVLGRLRSMVGAEKLELEVTLPPEKFDPDWEKVGLVEAAPHGTGRRQWWLTQIMSAVPPDHWLTRFGTTADAIVSAVLVHEFASALLDGLATATVRFGGPSWVRPLYDACARGTTGSSTTDPAGSLAALLAPDDVDVRLRAALRVGELRAIQRFPRPWPREASREFLAGLGTYDPLRSSALRIAALAIPADLLPDSVPDPEVPENDYRAPHYLRELDEFRFIASVRRAVAQESAP